MKPSNRSAGRRRGLGRSITALAGATVLTLLVTTVSMAGAGTLPPLGAALNPGTGVWTAAADGKLPADQTIKLPGMDGTATVGFEANGVAHITAGTDADMFRAMGYTHARFRLFQMDLARRVAEGRLAEAVGGSAALTSDKYELDVGLVRAAQRDWRELPAGSVARAALTSYATGVNDAIAQLARDHALPLYYKILNLPVAPWTPVDSLAIQRYETQTLSLDLLPTAYSYIARGLGEPLFNQMYQAMPQNPQNPYDPGPYRKLPLAPLPPRDDGTPTPQGTLTAADGQAAASTQYIGASPMAVAASSAILARAGSLPSGAFHTFGNSNIWVISGRLTASGKPILAADPHLSLTVPSIWYQMELRSPSYHVSGVSVPGIPAILIGKNQHIAWSITNSQRPGTLYYLEKTDKAHPGQYFWDGAWRPMTKITYKIRVKGRHPVTHTVRLTVHGPIMTNQGVAASVWYAGTLPSDNLTSIWQVARATDFAQFHQALRGWGVPAQNFGYADDMGNIGIVNVGYQPEIRSGVQWLPLSGTGASDVAGTIPYDALPIVYNPPQGFAATANQREVGASYPYYFGRGYDFIDQGWRAAEIVRDLGGRTGITAAQMARMQMDDADGTARALLPTLLRVLGGQPLGPLEAKAVNELKAWNYHLDGGSVAATIWTRFLILYDYAVWHPIWIQHHVPAPPRDVFTPRTSDGTYAEDALQGMLINLSVRDQANAIFAPPTAPGRTAASIMREVFAGTVKDLESKRGPDIATWRYGAKHYVMMASLLQQTVLDQGPYHYGGNGRVINSIVSVAPIRGGKRLFGVAAGGASYRMVTDWGTGQTLTAFPGGQSENHASPWYADGISGWLQGRMTPMIEGAQAVAASKGRIWTLTP